MISPISNSSMLVEMNAMRAGAANAPAPAVISSNSFGSMFKSAVEATNSAQQVSADVTRKFVAGESGVSAADVMRASHNAEIMMEATKQTRNKLLEHYKEIMNTQL